MAVKFLVNRFDFRVLVAGAQGHGAVPLIQGRNTALAGLVRVFHYVLGLSAAADAAARTGHDLHKVVLFSVRLHTLQEATGVGGAVNDRHVEGLAAQIHLGLPYAFISSDRAELEQGSRRRLAGEVGVGGAERSLHHTAGVAEDDAGTGYISPPSARCWGCPPQWAHGRIRADDSDCSHSFLFLSLLISA